MKSQNDREVRERFLTWGVESLSDAELVSLVIPAQKGVESVVVAERLLQSAGSIARLAHSTPSQVRQMEGLGMEGAMRVAAAAEFGRRVLLADVAPGETIHDHRDVASTFGPLIGGLAHEEMWVLYLSSANKILERRRISVGGLSSLTTDCRLIIRHALTLVAASIIVVHNHPSGTAEPSGEDGAFTEQLKKAAELFDINLLDHVIVTKSGSYSFRAEGRL